MDLERDRERGARGDGDFFSVLTELEKGFSSNLSEQMEPATIGMTASDNSAIEAV